VAVLGVERDHLAALRMQTVPCSQDRGWEHGVKYPLNGPERQGLRALVRLEAPRLRWPQARWPQAHSAQSR